MEQQSKEAIKMTENTLKRRGVSIYKENPFLLEVKTKTRRITNKRGDMMLINSETGEMQSQVAGFWESKKVDSTKFVKLYINGVKALKELTGAGTKVFEVLYERVQDNIGNDQIYMSFSAVDQTLMPMSNPTYDRGMRELVEKGFLAPSLQQGMFWLNPDYIFNGDKIAFVQTYQKAKMDKAIKGERDTKTIDWVDEENKKGDYK